jgi:hypothetical protein
VAEFGAGELNRGLISPKGLASGTAAVYFHATAESVKMLHLPAGEKFEPVKILEIDENEGRVRIYPIGTQPTPDRFGLPKYDVLRMIGVLLGDLHLPSSANEVPDLLERLPRGFLKDYQFGLGLAKAYRPIVTAIEEHVNCSELYLATEGGVKVDGKRLIVSLEDFEAVRREVDQITSRAHAAALYVKKGRALNWLARGLGRKEVPYKRGRHPMIQRFADASAGRETLEDAGIDDLVELMNRHTESIVSGQWKIPNGGQITPH